MSRDNLFLKNCARGRFKLVLSIVEVELPINLRVANKNNKLLDVITYRYLWKIKGQSNSVQISGKYCTTMITNLNVT